MSVGVVPYFVTFRIFALEQFRPLASGNANDKKCSGHVFCFKHIKNLWSPAGVRTIVKGDGQFLFGRAELINVIGKRISFELFPGEEISRRIVSKAAAAVFRSIDEVPHVTVAFENQVGPRRDIGNLVANGIGGMGGIPDGPPGSGALSYASEGLRLDTQAFICTNS